MPRINRLNTLVATALSRRQFLQASSAMMASGLVGHCPPRNGRNSRNNRTALHLQIYSGFYSRHRHRRRWLFGHAIF
jgi:hypothetical protein